MEQTLHGIGQSFVSTIIRHSTGDQIEYDKTGRGCDTYEGEEKFVHNFSWQT